MQQKIAPPPQPGQGRFIASIGKGHPVKIARRPRLFIRNHINKRLREKHGLYVLQGQGRYRLNDDWVDVEAGDYMWLRAFCPQACIATGDEPFRYLLYKDVNRHMPLGAAGLTHG